MTMPWASQRIARAMGVSTLALLIASACARSQDPEGVLVAARQLIEVGESGEAHIRLKKLLTQDGNVVAAHVLLAQIALDNGDVRGADSQLAALQPSDLENPDAAMVRCWVDLGLGRHAAVLRTLDSTQVRLPSTEIARLRAIALRMRGDAADGLPLLRDAIAANPEEGKLVAELASNLSAIGSLDQADHELTEFLKGHPKDADALHARGELRLRNGSIAKATVDLEAALAAAPPFWPAVKRMTAELLLGEAALSSGDLASAKERAAGLEKRYPTTLGTQLLSSRIALAEGRAGEAAEALQRISDAMPENLRVQSLLVDALLRSGHKARASAILERRIEQNPNDAQARRLLAELLMQQSRPDLVVELLGQAPDVLVHIDAGEDSLLSAARLASERAGAAIPSLEAQLAQEPANAQAQVQLAGAYLQSGQPRRGLATLDAANVESPSAVGMRMAINFALANEREVNKVVTSLLDNGKADAGALIAAADAALNAGRVDIADPLIEHVLKREPQNFEALLRRANLNFLEGEHEGAATALETLIALKPGDTRLRIAMARVAEAKKDIKGAREALQAGLNADPKSGELALMLASLELRAEQAKTAASVLDRMIQSAPQDGAAANAAGELLLRSRLAEEARSRFGRAVVQNETNARYRFNLGRAQFLVGDRAAAAQSFAQAAKLEPQWVDAHAAAVQLALDLKQRTTAEQMARVMVERIPGEPRSWLLLGESQMMSGRWQDAAISFAKAYEMRPSALAAVREHLARSAGKTAKPQQPLLNWLSREPNDLNVRRQLADFYQRTGAASSAVAQFEAIVKLAPNDVASINNLAWLLAESDTQRAESLARRAKAIMPRQAAIADTLGWVLIKAGKYSEAAEVLKRAATDMPQDRAVRYHYALAAARAGDDETARRELQAALRDGASFEGREAAKRLSQEIGS